MEVWLIDTYGLGPDDACRDINVESARNEYDDERDGDCGDDGASVDGMAMGEREEEEENGDGDDEEYEDETGGHYAETLCCWPGGDGVLHICSGVQR